MDDLLTSVAIIAIRWAGIFILVVFVFLMIFAYKWIFRERIEKRKYVNKIATEGYLASKNLLSIGDNPYQPESEEHDYWKRGFVVAERKKQVR